jgi:hypothetical protein
MAPASEHAMLDWMLHLALVDILDVDFDGTMKTGCIKCLACHHA